MDFDILVKQRDGWVSQADLQTRPVSGKALAAGDRAGTDTTEPAASALPLTKNPSFDGTVKRGAATCSCCSYTTPVTSVRTQLKKRHGGGA